MFKNKKDETMIEVLDDKIDIFILYARDSDVADAYDKKPENNLISDTQSKNKIFD